MGAYKEWSTDACYKVNEPWKYCAKWKKPVTKWHIFYIKYPAQTIEKRNRLVVEGWAVLKCLERFNWREELEHFNLMEPEERKFPFWEELMF